MRERIAKFPSRRAAVERMVAASRLSDAAKEIYLGMFRDRLRAIAQ